MHLLKSNYYTRQEFNNIDDINAVLLNILNNEVVTVTVTESKYLQVKGKKQNKISVVEEEINKQIKEVLKEKPIDKNIHRIVAG